MSEQSEKSKDGEEKIQKPNREIVWAIINYVISTSCFKSRQKELKVGPKQRPNKSYGSKVSDINDGSWAMPTISVSFSLNHLNLTQLLSILPLHGQLTTGNLPSDFDVLQWAM